MNRVLKKNIQDCEDAMQAATTFGEWRSAAGELDSLQGSLNWQREDESEEYNYRLIRQRLRQLRRYRENEDIDKLTYYLTESLHRNLGNISNPALYRHTHTGTKALIADYIDEVCASLEYLCDVDHNKMPFSEKMRFFKYNGQSFGRSALMLSGGATMGLFHIGVLKALWEQNLLPRVISGSSAGALISSVIACRTDDEIPALFDPDNLNLSAFRVLSAKAMLRDRAILDSRHLLKCIESNCGDYTFEEAFKRTGRIINITASPSQSNQMPRLLNYLTAPHVLISRAVLASCSIPGVFAPTTLMAKDSDGQHITYMPTLKWVDGSVRSDLPMLRLSRLHNVNHYIVSQTNPHVVPFINTAAPKHGVRPFMSSLAKATIRAQANEVLAASQRHTKSRVAQRLIGEVRGITQQKYIGDITLHPKLHPMKYAKLLSNPSNADLDRFILEGERATWPLIERIRVTSRVAITFDNCLKRLKESDNKRAADRGKPPVLTVVSG